MHSAFFRSTILRLFNLLQIEQGRSNFWGEPILQNGWIFWFHVLSFKFKSLYNLNSSSFITFQCIYMNQEYFSQRFQISKNWRGGDLSSWGKEFCRTVELFGHSFCISILKTLKTVIICHSSDFNAFCMIQEKLSQTFEKSPD